MMLNEFVGCSVPAFLPPHAINTYQNNKQIMREKTKNKNKKYERKMVLMSNRYANIHLQLTHMRHSHILNGAGARVSAKNEPT